MAQPPRFNNQYGKSQRRDERGYDNRNRSDDRFRNAPRFAEPEIITPARIVHPARECIDVFGSRVHFTKAPLARMNSIAVRMLKDTIENLESACVSDEITLPIVIAHDGKHYAVFRPKEIIQSRDDGVIDVHLLSKQGLKKIREET